MIASSANTAVGTYARHFAQAPGEFIVPGGDEGRTLESAANDPGNITVGDLDMWRFTAANNGAIIGTHQNRPPREAWAAAILSEARPKKGEPEREGFEKNNARSSIVCPLA